MAMATTSAAMPAAGRAPPSCTAIAVPASTGATDAASVAGRTADHQTRPGLSAVVATIGLRALREFAEVGLALLHVRVAALLRLFAEVVEKGRVAGELLDAGETVIGRVQPRLQHSQRERAELVHATAPLDRRLLERREGHDLVDEPHVECLLRVVLLAQKPDLARLFLA